MPKSRQRKNKKTFISSRTRELKEDEKEKARLEEERKLVEEKIEEEQAQYATADTLLENDFDIEEIQGKTETFINNNKGTFLAGILGLFVLAACYFGYKNVYVPSQDATSQADLFKAQQYFAIDSFRLALNGDGSYPGFLEISDSYGGKGANLANYYAGVSYLNLGEFENAIDYLERFNGNDQLVSVMAKGALGDAYSELGQDDKGITFYKQAANMNANELTSPMFLLKAGLAMERKGDFAGAKTMFEKIKEYPNSAQATDADKYLAKVESKL